MHVVVITGPTASGKSAAAVRLARELGCEIISADSRQVFRGMPIATAVIPEAEREGVPHHLLEFLEPEEYYSAARFEEDALRLLSDMERRGHDRAIVCGGSMMYIDALLYGLDDLPTVSEAVRAETLLLYKEQGLEAVRAELARLDPAYLAAADPANHRRLVHALEIIRESGRPVSELRTGRRKERPFTFERRVIELPRAELFARINARVDAMVAAGLEEEARRLYPRRHLNALNTVGLKEFFACFDGAMDRATAIARIAKNTRVYAKKQLTWLARAPR